MDKGRLGSRCRWGGPALLALGGLVAAHPLPAQQRITNQLAARVSSKLDTLVPSVMAAREIPGAAMVLVGDGRVLVSRGWGVADIASHRPVDPARTIFRIGSTSKALTSLAVLQLADANRISLDAPVSVYVHLPALEKEPFGRPILVRHLLEHTGGFDQRGLNRRADAPSERASMGAFLASELKPVRPPGAVPVYDTYGMTLAGYLVQTVSGTPYAEYMRRHLFLPLGMTRTFVETPDTLRADLAMGYGIEDDTLSPQPYEWYVTRPASSIDATAQDMGRLMLAILDGGPAASRVLGAGTRTLLDSIQHRWPGGQRAFSWGWWEDQRNGLRVLHHGGIMAGFSSELFLLPEAGIGLFIVYNRDPETGPDPRLRETVVDSVVSWMIPETRGNAPPQDMSSEAPPPTGDLSDFAGAWGSTMGCFTCAEGEGWAVSTLNIEAEPPRTLLLPGQRWERVGRSVFRLEGGDRRIAFLRDDEGRIRYLLSGTRSWVRLDDALYADIDGPEWTNRPPSPLQALGHRAAGQWTDAEDAYASLAQRYPTNGRYPFYEGFSALHRDRSAAAFDAFGRAAALDQWKPWSVYYQGAARCLAGRMDEALSLLGQAIDMGFDDARLMRTEPWWDGIRNDPRFVALVRKLDPGGDP